MQTSHPKSPQHRQSAFTLVELMVVIGCLALLALTVLPALAGGWDKSSRLQCADNLRQLHAASMQFAHDNDEWLPMWTHPSTRQINIMTGSWYSRYVWQGQANWSIDQSPNQPLGQFQNTGHLYGAGLIGDGKVLFCPTLDGKGSPLGAEPYEPLLTSDASGNVRSSYHYNPRVADPNGANLRRFQRTSDLEPRKLFAVDYLGEGNMAHFSERGWNVIFTDGSVCFSTSELVYQLIQQGWPANYNNVQLEYLFDLLEEER